jgi:hypothetical protein
VVRQASGGPLAVRSGGFVGGTAETFLAMAWVGPA